MVRASGVLLLLLTLASSSGLGSNPQAAGGPGFWRKSGGSFARLLRTRRGVAPGLAGISRPKDFWRGGSLVQLRGGGASDVDDEEVEDSVEESLSIEFGGQDQKREDAVRGGPELEAKLPPVKRSRTLPLSVRDVKSVTRNRSIRPEVKSLSGDLEFQLLDLDYKKGNSVQGSFTIDAFGATAEGNSVHLSIVGFEPFFFVSSPKGLSADETKDFVNRLNYKVKENIASQAAWAQGSGDVRVLRAVSVKRKSIWGYQRHDSDFIQIFCTSPEAVRRAATVLRTWDASLDMPYCFGQGPTAFKIFEANVDPITRLSTNSDLVISGWVRVPGGEYDAREEQRDSWCDIDVTSDIGVLRRVEGREDVAPFLVGSFDIECVPEGGRGFPDPTKPHDKCIQIGTSVYRFGEDKPFVSSVLALESVDEVEGVSVRYFATEAELLLAWRDLVVLELDLDMLTGHNIFKFDLNYIAKRAEQLGLSDFWQLGRIKNRMSAVRSVESQTTAFGHNEFHYLPMTGRFQVDIFQVIKKDHRLSSYKLESLSQKFLGEGKDDVSPKQIFAYQVKDSHHRAIVAKYCARDCELVYRLMMRLDILPQYLEMSKVTGVTMNDLCTRGQQIKVFTQIVREATASGFVIPEMKHGGSSGEDQYSGAFVLAPKSGMYTEPIATLDFASLYPSIIQADNLSYETLVSDPSQLDPSIETSTITVESGSVIDVQLSLSRGSHQVTGATDDAGFVKLVSQSQPGNRIIFGTHKKTDPVSGDPYTIASVEGNTIHLTDPVAPAATQGAEQLTIRKAKLLRASDYTYVQSVEGILPRICKNLLQARKKAKKEMGMTDDPVRKGLLNGKQLALKISCNSVYGFTGASKGMLPCVAIASSVTAIGQQMIKTTAQTVEQLFNASVIYGDTDSVMVNFHCGDGPGALEKALEMGKVASSAVTKKFKPPNELEFEKVYMPYFLYSKKRYAGQMYTRPDKPDKVDVKGLQVVRRDRSQMSRDVMKAVIDCMVLPVSPEEEQGSPGLCKEEILKRRLESKVEVLLRDLVEARVPWDKYVITQSISKKGYEEKNAAGMKSASLGHVKLAERMEKREPGTGPVSGDRVQFVVVKEAPHLSHIRDRTITTLDANNKSIVSVTYQAKDWPPRHERCEDPEFARQHNLTIDHEYYLHTQLKKPIIALLEPLFSEAHLLFQDAERLLKSRATGNRMLTSFFKPSQAPRPPPAAAATEGTAEASSSAAAASAQPPQSQSESPTSDASDTHGADGPNGGGATAPSPSQGEKTRVGGGAVREENCSARGQASLVQKTLNWQIKN